MTATITAPTAAKFDVKFRALTSPQPGFYQQGESQYLCKDNGADLCDSADDALYYFGEYWSDNGDCDCEDVTETENFIGWGNVYRVTSRTDMDDAGNPRTWLYTVEVVSPGTEA